MVSNGATSKGQVSTMHIDSTRHTDNSSNTEQNEMSNFKPWNNMPWVVALFIGITTLYLGHRQLKSNERTIKLQIESMQKIAKLDFNKTVISGNRQEWINDLRNSISLYMAKIDAYELIVNYEKDNYDKITSKFEEIMNLELKINLLLNPDEKDSKRLKKLIRNYTRAISKEAITQPPDELKLYISEATQKILKTEWERVKRGV